MSGAAVPQTDDGFLALFRAAVAESDRVFARIDGSVPTFGALDRPSGSIAAGLA